MVNIIIFDWFQLSVVCISMCDMISFWFTIINPCLYYESIKNRKQIMSVAVTIFLYFFRIALFILEKYENAHIRSSYRSNTIPSYRQYQKKFLGQWPKKSSTNIGKILRSSNDIEKIIRNLWLICICCK